MPRPPRLDVDEVVRPGLGDRGFIADHGGFHVIDGYAEIPYAAEIAFERGALLWREGDVHGAEGSDVACLRGPAVLFQERLDLGKHLVGLCLARPEEIEQPRVPVAGAGRWRPRRWRRP